MKRFLSDPMTVVAVFLAGLCLWSEVRRLRTARERDEYRQAFQVLADAIDREEARMLARGQR